MTITITHITHGYRFVIKSKTHGVIEGFEPSLTLLAEAIAHSILAYAPRHLLTHS